MEENNIEENTIQEEMLKKVEEQIEKIKNDGINNSNLDHLMKLEDIHYKITKEKIMKKEDNDMYRDYGEYGDNYGRRGVPGTGRGRYRRYRGEDALDEMKYHYGAYQDSYNTGNYNAKENSSYKMTEAFEKFIYAVGEELDPKDKQMLKQSMQEMVQKM